MERAGTPAHDGAAQAGLRARADGMLSQLTGAEKIAMLHQWSPGVPRLGIAAFRTGTEALHGAAWHGAATVFPQAAGLGATWDPDLLTAVGAAVSAEVRALHERDPRVSLNVWAPVVNLLRDPRWGRNEEGYSEDPLLTARLAVAYCTGLRGDHPVFWRTAPVLKHFFAHNNETGRDTSSSVVPARVLHEYDLAPFRGPVAAGAAAGVMPSYNLVNGRPNHVSPYLDDALRRWTPGDLVVCSDAQAPSNLVDTERYFAGHADSHAAALRAGVDSFTDHDADSGVTAGRITEGLRRGLITMADVDRAVRRLLLLRLRLGEFDPGLDPYRAAGRPIPDPAHRDLARRAARQSFVLLKNDAGLLPLDPAPGLRLAVAGPFADTLRTDWYSGTMPYQVTVAAGLRDALAGAGGTVIVAEGADRVRLAAAGGRGPDLGEFDVFDWGPGTLGTVVTFRSAATGRYLTVAEDGTLAADAARPGGWVVRETFTVQDAPAGSGEDALAGSGEDAGDGAPAGEAPPGPSRPVVLRATATGRYVAAGDTPGELRASAPDAAGAQRFRWEVRSDGAAAAAQAAAAAGICVLVLGNEPMINGRETQDRVTLALPPAQARLAAAILAACPRLVLVIMSSYPYALGPLAGQVPAIAWTSHGGQETGRAVAGVLLGAHGPEGRLAQTWYASDDDLPGLLDYDIIAARRTYLYFDGSPLYPFGHGLAYTTFRYTGLRLDPARLDLADLGPGHLDLSDLDLSDLDLSGADASHLDEPVLTASVTVSNTGTRDGTEVVQCYTGPAAPRRPRPRGALAAFTRLTLAPGESRTVHLPVPLSALAYWDTAAGRMTVDPGEYLVQAGSSATAIHQVARLAVCGPEPPARRLLGARTAAASFDDYQGITLLDETPERGDVVAPAGPGPGWIRFRDVAAWPGRPRSRCAPPARSRARPRSRCTPRLRAGTVPAARAPRARPARPVRPARPAGSRSAPSPCRAPAAGTGTPR